VKARRSTWKLAHLGAGNGPLLDPLGEDELALAADANGPELLAEFERGGRTAEPMIDGPRRDDRRTETEARVAQTDPRCSQQARLSAQQIEPFE
jgi:hypothetical protein